MSNRVLALVIGGCCLVVGLVCLVGIRHGVVTALSGEPSQPDA